LPALNAVGQDHAAEVPATTLAAGHFMPTSAFPHLRRRCILAAASIFAIFGANCARRPLPLRRLLNI